MSHLHRLSWFTRVRALVAVSSILVIIALAVLAASPTLHAKLHGGNIGSDDGCPVAAFAGGLTVTAATVIATPPVVVSTPTRVALPVQLFLDSPRYLRQPERGPPISG